MVLSSPTGVSRQEKGHISGILEKVKTHGKMLDTLREDHSGQAASIEQKAIETFQQRYMVCCLTSILCL